jgi:hypothetical protein
MSENRRQVLEMLSEGQITAVEADRLIAAMEGGQAPAATAVRPESPALAAPRYIRVQVDVDEEDDGPVKVNVRVPVSLLRAGVKLASLIPGPAQEAVNRALRERGLPFDVTQVRPENLDELIGQLGDFTVDVDQPKDNVKVRVFCE